MYLRYVLACCVFAASQVAGENVIYALLGKKACFNTDVRTPPDEILWKHDENKVVEFNGRTQEVFGSFIERVSMDWHSADLNISEAIFEDSGLYELETYTNKALQRAQYTLKVIDKVTKPTISCEMMKGNDSDKSGHKATLTCSAESKQSQSLLKFTWSPNIDGQLGPKLIIPLGDEHDNQEYSCTVHNPLTEESATFIAKKCYPDESSSIPMIVGISVGCVFMILIIVGILCRKGKKTNDLEKQKAREITEDPTEVGNGDLETASLLGRAPTMPSNQRLSHLVRHNKGSHLTQDDQFMKELTKSVRKRPSAEDKDQADGDEPGETVKENLERDLPDSGKINDAMSKQSSEPDKIILSPIAPEKPPRQDPAELADDVLEKITKKRATNPPPVAKKTASVKNYKTKVDENKPPEETKELPDQNLGEKDKVTESETSLPLALLPESNVLKSPVPKSSDQQPPVPESSDQQPPVPKSPDSQPPVPKSPDSQPPVPKSPDSQPPVPKSSDQQPPVPKSSDQQPPVPKSSDQQPPVPKSSDQQPPVPKSSDQQPPVPKSSDQQPPVTELSVPSCKSPVPLPRSRLSQAYPKNENQKDPSSDQVAGQLEAYNSDKSVSLGSGEKSERPTISSESTGTVTTHEQHPPVTETNQGEETLQKNNKQVPGEKPKPDGEGDQEEIDPHFNTLKEPQNLELLKPDNIKAETSPESSDAAQAVPDHKNQDNTRQSSHSETGPEKEDKSETAEGKNGDQS